MMSAEEEKGRLALKDVPWDDFNVMSPEEKGRYLMHDGIPEHVLVAQQFSRSDLERVCTFATRIRMISKQRAGRDFLTSLLSDKRAMLYFSQPSSRTFLSFCAACEILGLRLGEVRDTATSSEVKGESREDSVRTFSSYFDLIIMRTMQKGLAERTAWVLSQSDRPVPIVNAGSGADQHPTQAVLDIYTLSRSFERQGGIDGKHIVFCGDLARGRTVRSLAQLLLSYEAVHLSFVAPDKFQIGDDIIAALEAAGVRYDLNDDLEACLPNADAVYMTRIQDEWDEVDGESSKVDFSRFSINVETLSLLKGTAVIMHPLPRRDEIHPDVDRDPRAVYWRQVRNGMWVRTALIAQMFGCEDVINAYFTKHAEA
ncbi:MAG: aspartate carbamoyltransferase catalytic subunit [Candidatus Promineifilaceae bacterium]|jgi:aspartate carbamoyltransferase catalytic subunit